MLRLQCFKYDGFDFCKGDALMIDAVLWPINGLLTLNLRLVLAHLVPRWRSSKKRAGNGWDHTKYNDCDVAPSRSKLAELSQRKKASFLGYSYLYACPSSPLQPQLLPLSNHPSSHCLICELFSCFALYVLIGVVWSYCDFFFIIVLLLICQRFFLFKFKYSPEYTFLVC